MIQFTPHMRILVATTPLDMRKGMDGIAALCKHQLQENPMSGAVFLFISRSRKILRILSYDGQGFWLCSKRLSSGRFPHWSQPGAEGEFIRAIEAYQAQVLLHGGDPMQVKALGSWKKIVKAPAFFAGVA
jgi:transposase